MGRTGGRWEMVVERGPNRDWNFQPSLPFFSGLCPCSNFGKIISFSFFFSFCTWSFVFIFCFHLRTVYFKSKKNILN
jgi:ABC-type nickel/cobalt efflux system permease component RcnA